MRNFLHLKENKTFPKKDDNFSRINQMLCLPILQVILQFSKCVPDYKKPFLQFFSSKTPTSSISTPGIKNLDVKHHDMLYSPRAIGETVVKYESTFYLSSISPIYIKNATSMSLCSKFKKLLGCLDECRWISSKTTDRSEIEYRKLISEANIMEEMSKFEMRDR